MLRRLSWLDRIHSDFKPERQSHHPKHDLSYDLGYAVGQQIGKDILKDMGISLHKHNHPNNINNTTPHSESKSDKAVIPATGRQQSHVSELISAAGICLTGIIAMLFTGFKIRHKKDNQIR